MSETTKRKCGCEYRSESAASVRKGYELGGYLVKACPEHTPRKEPPMRSPEDFPADIDRIAADIVCERYRDEEDMQEAIARALMERDRAATERCIEAIRGEALENPDNDEDRAYNVALNHAEYAIRSRQMTGFLASLTDEQKKAALAYDGPENHGDAAAIRSQP